MKPEEKIERAYEELRQIIDGGSESFTHDDAVEYLKEKLAQPEQEPVAFDEQKMLKLCPHYGPCPAFYEWIAGYKAAHSIKE